MEASAMICIYINRTDETRYMEKERGQEMEKVVLR